MCGENPVLFYSALYSTVFYCVLMHYSLNCMALYRVLVKSDPLILIVVIKMAVVFLFSFGDMVCLLMFFVNSLTPFSVLFSLIP